MGWDTSSKLSALMSPVGRDLSRHWRFTGVAAAIVENESWSDGVARSGQKSGGNIAPQCNPIERIVVGKGSQSRHILLQGVASRAGADDVSRRDFHSIHGLAQKHGAHVGGIGPLARGCELASSKQA